MAEIAKIARAVQKIFASAAGTGEIEQIGSLRNGAQNFTTDVPTLQTLSQYASGLLGIVSATTLIPELSDLNALHYMHSYQNAYLFQEGIAEWDSATTYYTNSLVKKVGTKDLYYSTTNSNINNAVTDTGNWLPYSTSANTASAVVQRDSSGNFSAGTITASITGNAGTVTNGVYTTGNQTITGTKTFNSTIFGSINGNSATVTNGLYSSGSYSNPSWLTAIAGSKVSGNISGNAANITAYTINQNLGTANSPTFNLVTQTGKTLVLYQCTGYSGSSAPYTVKYGTPIHDTLSEFDTATNTFTATNAGHYSISVSFCNYQNSGFTGAWAQINLLYNGNVWATGSAVNYVASAPINARVSALLYLSAGDRISASASFSTANTSPGLPLGAFIAITRVN